MLQKPVGPVTNGSGVATEGVGVSFVANVMSCLVSCLVSSKMSCLVTTKYTTKLTGTSFILAIWYV